MIQETRTDRSKSVYIYTDESGYEPLARVETTTGTEQEEALMTGLIMLHSMKSGLIKKQLKQLYAMVEANMKCSLLA